MKDDIHPSGVGLRTRLPLTYAIVALGAVLVSEGVAWLGLALIARATRLDVVNWGWHAAVVSAVVAVVGWALGTWVSGRLVGRLERVLETCRAWLRGNLSLRIADAGSDDLGLLGEQLDLLAEHLDQDEQDLGELRVQSARMTDQVRALAVDEERDRLARELHDGVKQHLFSLAMTASAIRTQLEASHSNHIPGRDVVQVGATDGGLPGLVDMSREAEITALNAQRELTRLIENLRPASLQEQGLAGALNDYTLLFGAREHVLVYLDVQGNDALLPLPVAEALYRVAQESLHNVARHARATRVDVHLHCLPEQVRLSIRDNGVGFDTGKAHQGLGLTNMQERILVVSGRLRVRSQVGVGTTVLAEVGLTPSVETQTEIARLDKGRPRPTIENWAWLGQRLVIPVGQTWPWLPADEVHLRQPLLEPGKESLLLRRTRGPLRLWQGYALQQGQQRGPLVRVRHRRFGYEWRSQRAMWALRSVRGLRGSMVLLRNGQPLAAIQHQGRLLNIWSEIVYDGRGYRLSCCGGLSYDCTLVDGAGDLVLSVRGEDTPQIEVHRALPLPLLVMVAVRVADEMPSTKEAAGSVEVVL